MVDKELNTMLNKVFSWSQAIRNEANRSKNDGIDDSALIIQELIEDYLHDKNINPRNIINYEKHGIKGKVRYDRIYKQNNN